MRNHPICDFPEKKKRPTTEAERLVFSSFDRIRQKTGPACIFELSMRPARCDQPHRKVVVTGCHMKSRMSMNVTTLTPFSLPTYY
jgi:hypothetical protein